MMDRLLDKFPLPRPVCHQTTGVPAAPEPRSVHVFPVFALHEPGQPGEDQQEQHDPKTEPAACRLARVADVVEEIDGVAHEAIILGRGEASGCKLLKMVKDLLMAAVSLGDVPEYRGLEP